MPKGARKIPNESDTAKGFGETPSSSVLQSPITGTSSVSSVLQGPAIDLTLAWYTRNKVPITEPASPTEPATASMERLLTAIRCTIYMASSEGRYEEGSMEDTSFTRLVTSVALNRLSCGPVIRIRATGLTNTPNRVRADI